MLSRAVSLGLIVMLAGCYRSSTPPVTAKELVSQAQAKVERGDRESAVKLLEEALALEPANTKVLAMLVQTTQVHGLELAERKKPGGYEWMQKSADYLRRLRQQDKELAGLPPDVAGLVFYNEACALALAGQKAQALESLNQSLEMYPGGIALLETHADLNSLRDMPEFKALLSQRQEKARAAAKAQVASLLTKNQPFDFSFELESVDGKRVSLADYAGKVLIVDVWGTWCPPCLKEVPHFVALHKKYRDQGLEIVGINYEKVEPDKVKETIKDFVDKNGVTYTCVIGDDKTQQRIPNMEAYPTTLFLDRTGKVRAKIVGYHDLSYLEAIVTALLEEKAVSAGGSVLRP